MALKDTLDRLKRKEKQAAIDRPATIAEWRGAVESLLKKIRSFLSEYEKDGSLSLEARRVRVAEEILGSYEIEAMDIKAGPAVVVVRPVGYFIVGAEGRVDMHRMGRPAEEDRVMFLRLRHSGPAYPADWFISFAPDATSRRAKLYPTMPRTREVEPVTRDGVERALDALLR